MGIGLFEVNIQPYKGREGVSVLRMYCGVQKISRWVSGVTHLDPSMLQEIVEVVTGECGARFVPVCGGDGPRKEHLSCVTQWGANPG